jgi:ribosomal protein S27AE
MAELLDPEAELLEQPTDFQEMPPEVPISPEIEGENAAAELFHETREGRLLSQLIEDLEEPEKNVREAMVKVWRKMENYWRDRQYVIWDEIASDWRTPGELAQANKDLNIDPAAYAKIVNVYKAHGQAIISALSAGLPYVQFFPDDADSQDDVFTAKAYSKLATLIQKRNKGQLVFIKALFYIYNFGTAFAYNENKDTTQFGTVKRPIYVDTPITTRQEFCPACGFMLGSNEFPTPPPEAQPVPGMPPQMPESGSVQGMNSSAAPVETCPQCGNEIQADHEDFDDIIPILTGYSDDPKTHETIEVFSGLHVKFPHWCTTQSQTPYLSLETDENVAMLQEIYKEVADKIGPSGASTSYEKQSRQNSDYRGDEPGDLCTFKRSWIRPWAFNRLGVNKQDDIDYLKGLYPEGVYIAKVEDLIVEAVPDKLDDHWTATIDPTSMFVHADPMAQSLVPIQDITNELTNLTLETVEFGIPETFYESDAIDSEQYSKSEARPGMLYPAKSRAGMGLDSSFHTIKTSALSQEVDTFADRMTQAGQFVSGAFPTIWGGAMEGGGGTAREYEQSRSMALQRLNLCWLNVKMWWADVMSKSVRSFATNMKDDEKYVEKKGNSFINVWIKRAEMQGKVGQVEPDVNEAFPISWSQKRDILMGLIGMKNPLVDMVIGHPENSGVVASTIGFPELYIPGDDARSKQLWEISILVQSAPTPTGIPDMNKPGQELLQPTIPVEKWEVHQVESEACKAWLMSEVGIDAKMNNPGGYMNVVAHMDLHDFQIAEAQMREQAQEAEKTVEEGPDGKKKKVETQPESGQEG